MAIHGQCDCGNIRLRWQTVDLSLVPRACQCDYCAGRGALWTSKQGTRFSVTIRRPGQHRTISHGSRIALFHECTHCDRVVFVSAELDGALYGAINAHCLRNPAGFAPAVATDFSIRDAAQKHNLWRRNWCSPITIDYDAG